MKRTIIALLFCLFVSAYSNAQSPGQPNESLNLAEDPNTGIFTMSWWAKAGRTYFIQQSSDLVNWAFLPMMDSASEEPLSYNLTSSAADTFWRLRYTDITYDEWAESVGYSPDFPPFPPDPNSAAPGNPSLTILQCYQNGYLPFSWYAGREPVLTKIGGDNQTGDPGQTLPQTLTVLVTDQLTGAPLAGAPVYASITGGDFNGSVNGNNTTLSDGTISFTFTTPPDPGATTQVSVLAGDNNDVSTVFTEFTIPLPDPPTGVNVAQNADGSIDMSWQYSPDNSVSFDIQIRGPLGDWVTVGTVPPNTLSVHINADGTIAQ